MALSSDLISQFGKLMKTEKDTNTETTVYGTIVKYNSATYVRIDGSDLMTPVATTAAVKDGERVTVRIKDHSATVTGNISSPSASNSTVQEIGAKTDATSSKITDVEILIADKVSTDDFDAQVARINSLQAENVIIKDTLAASDADIGNLSATYVEITKRLTVAEADIDNLDTTKLDATVATLTYATISDLEATDANIHNLQATYVDFEVATTNRFTAINATIDNLDSKYATISDLDVERGRIDDLETNSLTANSAVILDLQTNSLTANSAVIKNLQSDVADIDTLIFGSASGSTIQTSFANAVIAQLGNAKIKSAMIESVSADKITAGDIITNNVRVMSEDGKLLISDETIQISDSTRARVQIGKDAAGDYSINIWDADGQLMFSEGGITDDAIKQAIIRDDMVSDTANISAHKLNIDTLFEVINGSTKTIKSSKILIDSEGQTLDVVFSDLMTDMSSMTSTVSSQGTSLSIVQGQISGEIWKQDIVDAINDIEVGGRNLLLNSNHQYSNSDYCPAYYTPSIPLVPGEEYTISLNVTPAEGVTHYTAFVSSGRCSFCTLNVEGTENQTITKTITMPSYYTGKTPDDNILYANIGVYRFPNDGTVTGKSTFHWMKIEKGNKATDWTPAPEDVDADISTLNTQYSSVKQDVDDLSVVVASHTTEISNKAEQSVVAEVTDRVSSLEIGLNGFKTSVSENYATKTEMNTAIEDIEIGGRNLIPNSDKPIEIAASNYTYVYKKAYSELMQGETYTFSAEINLVGTEDLRASIRLYNFDGAVDGGIYNLTADGSRVSQTFTVTKNTPCLLLYAGVAGATANISATYTNVKLERGTKATDWTPAPEDLETEVDELTTRMVEAESTITQNAESIATVVSRTEVVENSVVTAQKTADAAKKQLWHKASGEGDSALYVAFARITIGGSYQNCPIRLSLRNRGKVASDVDIQFKNVSGSDPGVSSIRENGGIDTWIFKMDTSTWYVIAKKSESWDTLYVTDFVNPNGNITVDWINILYSELPTENITQSTKLVGSAVASTIATKSEITQLSDQITAAVSRVSDNETAISTLEINADSLTSKVSSVENDAETALTNAANAQSDIDSLTIGGRNLLKDSRHVQLFSNNTNYYPITSETIIENGREFKRYKRTETTLNPTTMSLYSAIPVTRITEYLTGVECTFSFLIRCSHEVSTSTMNRLVANGNNYEWSPSNVRHNINTEWKRLSVTATIGLDYDPSNSSHVLRFNPYNITIPAGEIDNFYIDVCEWKIEKGNRATDWTSAPEEMESEVDSLTTRMSDAESAIVQHSDSITSTVTRVTAVEKDTETALTNAANAQADIDDLSIGGRNLLLKSDVEYENNSYYVCSYTPSSPLTPGVEYTISIDITPGEGLSQLRPYVSGGYTQLCQLLVNGTDRQTVMKTFTMPSYYADKTPDDNAANANVAFYRFPNDGTVTSNTVIHTVKIEKGNRATDWSPAPEDVNSSIDEVGDTALEAKSTADGNAERLDQATSIIQQLSDSITMLVVDESGESLMTQDGDRWLFSMATYNEALNSVSAGLHTLTEDVGDTQNTVNVLTQAVEDLGVLSDYIAITTYNNQPCIELGEYDSEFKLRITNTEIQFVEGTAIPAYLSNQKLYIEKAEVTGELQQGEFVWKARSNGNLGLIWKGGTS